MTWLKGTLLRRTGRGSNTLPTETLAPAVDALRSASLVRRMAAIGTLERIARDNIADHWLAIESLTAYLRHRAPWPANDPETAEQGRADIQAAISVLGRRNLASPPEEAAHRLDLRHVDLRRIRLRRGQGHFEFAMFNGSSLARADLRHAELGSANLQGADLSQTNLGKANLRGAFLQRANLRGARLSGTNLWDAALVETDLRGATLRRAGLVDARLQGADLSGADLRGASVKLANFRSAKGLTCKQLTKATGWQRAYRDESLACGAAIPV